MLRVTAALIVWTGIAFVALVLFAPQFAYVPGCYGRMIPPRPTDSPACLAAQPANLQPAAGIVIVIGYMLIVAYAAILAARARSPRSAPRRE
jgi:ABC-type Na+ efflux pump permease subunit